MIRQDFDQTDTIITYCLLSPYMTRTPVQIGLDTTLVTAIGLLLIVLFVPIVRGYNLYIIPIIAGVIVSLIVGLSRKIESHRPIN